MGRLLSWLGLAANPPEVRPTMTDDSPCPCGSGRTFGACCGPFILGTSAPDTAEQLMRSRFSAYTIGNADWLRETWHPATRRGRIEMEPAVRWTALKILATEAGGPADTKGIVEFVARYKLHGRAHRLHERSRFQRREGRWFYVDGNLVPGAGDADD